MSAGNFDCVVDEVSAGSPDSVVVSFEFEATLAVGEPFDVSSLLDSLDAAAFEAVEAGDLSLDEDSDNGGSLAFCAST